MAWHWTHDNLLYEAILAKICMWYNKNKNNLISYNREEFIPHSAVIFGLWLWFPMILGWFPIFLWRYNKKKKQEKIIIRNRVHPHEFVFLRNHLLCYPSWFLEYKLTWVNSFLHGHPWWLLCLIDHLAFWQTIYYMHIIPQNLNNKKLMK